MTVQKYLKLKSVQFKFQVFTDCKAKNKLVSLFLGESTARQLAYSFIQPLLKYIVMKQPEEMHHWIEDNIFYTSLVIILRTVLKYTS